MPIANQKSLVVIGASTGGLAALSTLLAALPSGFPWPIVIVQHRRPEPEDGLARLLGARAGRAVQEPLDKQVILPGSVYLAPPDYHLLIDGGAFALTLDAPVHHARPSVDVLFESAAAALGPAVLGVVLTGAGDDGAQGVRRIKASGGRVLAQEPATAECPAMPQAAIDTGAVDWVEPLGQLAARLAALCPAVTPAASPTPENQPSDPP